jgi:hypothetical protein
LIDTPEDETNIRITLGNKNNISKDTRHVKHHSISGVFDIKNQSVQNSHREAVKIKHSLQNIKTSKAGLSTQINTNSIHNMSAILG